MDIPFSIEAVVDRFEGDYGVLRTVDGQEILWPAARIPDDFEEGSTLRLAIVTDEVAGGGASAHDILNEIFSGDDQEV